MNTAYVYTGQMAYQPGLSGRQLGPQSSLFWSGALSVLLGSPFGWFGVVISLQFYFRCLSDA